MTLATRVCRLAWTERSVPIDKNTTRWSAGVFVLEFTGVSPKRRAVGLLRPPWGLLLVAALGSQATAQTAQNVRARSAVDFSSRIACPQWSAGTREELLARLQLLVHSAPSPGVTSVSIRCHAGRVRVTVRWPRERRSTSVADDDDAVDSVLSVIEAWFSTPAKLLPSGATEPQLENRSRTSERPATAKPLTTSGGRDPSEALGSAPPPPRTSQTSGGVGLGIGIEPWPAPASTGVGPRLELGWGSGSWVATSVESLRFGETPSHRLILFDALVGVAWGAPFGPEPLGTSLMVGGEWLSAIGSSTPTGERTRSSSVLNLGVCGARSWTSIALKLGVDARLRLRDIELAEPLDARLARWSLIASIGGVLTVR